MKVLDFGLAKAFDRAPTGTDVTVSVPADMTRTGTVMGIRHT